MKRILKRIEDLGIDVSKLTALEIFAREGDWFTKELAKKVKNIELWEINKAYIKNLSLNLPKAKIKNVDSISYMKDCEDKFDIVSIDNPQGIYAKDYCEHFDVLNQKDIIINNWGGKS